MKEVKLDGNLVRISRERFFEITQLEYENVKGKLFPFPEGAPLSEIPSILRKHEPKFTLSDLDKIVVEDRYYFEINPHIKPYDYDNVLGNRNYNIKVYNYWKGQFIEHSEAMQMEEVQALRRQHNRQKHPSGAVIG